MEGGPRRDWGEDVWLKTGVWCRMPGPQQVNTWICRAEAMGTMCGRAATWPPGATIQLDLGRGERSEETCSKWAAAHLPRNLYTVAALLYLPSSAQLSSAREQCRVYLAETGTPQDPPLQMARQTSTST